jgi:hypothetical protein
MFYKYATWRHRYNSTDDNLVDRFGYTACNNWPPLVKMDQNDTKRVSDPLSLETVYNFSLFDLNNLDQKIQIRSSIIRALIFWRQMEKALNKVFSSKKPSIATLCI